MGSLKTGKHNTPEMPCPDAAAPGMDGREAAVDHRHSAILNTARQWQLAVDTIADPIFLHDGEFRILRANKAYAREAGMAVQDVIGKPYWEVFPRLTAPLPGCLSTLSRQSTEDVVTIEDGRTLLCCNYTVFTDNDDYLFSVHVLQVIGGHRQRPQLLTDLQMVNDYLSDITETMPDILFDFDPASFAPLYVSPAAQRILGFEPRRFVEEPGLWFSTVHTEDQRRVLYEIRRAVSNRQDVILECRNRHGSSGDYVWLEIRARPVLDESGEVIRLIGIATDISDRRRMVTERLESTERLNRSLIQSIMAITSLMEKRDPYTAGHQHNVVAVSVAIAREIGLDEYRISGVELGAQVHDIGKICVPAEILNRPGSLTNAEFEIIKTHPLVGYDILKMIDFPWPIANMVRQHHERFDGSGYPDGLCGDEILLEARIIAVADVFEAMSSHRPYRPSNGIQQAIEFINRNKDTLFDAQVIEAFNRLVEQELLPSKQAF